jgi:hypothetical protein
MCPADSLHHQTHHSEEFPVKAPTTSINAETDSRWEIAKVCYPAKGPEKGSLARPEISGSINETSAQAKK